MGALKNAAGLIAAAPPPFSPAGVPPPGGLRCSAWPSGRCFALLPVISFATAHAYHPSGKERLRPRPTITGAQCESQHDSTRDQELPHQ